ncbi:MAG: asparaginase, partial [Gaiellaceae bacterium]
NALSVGGWGSPAAGPLGRVVEGRPSVWLTPAYDDFLGLPHGSDLPRVELLRMALGAGPEALEAVLATQPAGLVIDGFGGGHVPPALLGVIDEAVAQGVAVVMTSRVGDGPTNRSTYGAPGCEIDLQDRGALMAGALSGVKARLRLSVALALGMGAADVFPID